MKFNPNDYNSHTVMHCETEEEAKIFCNFLHESGRRWCDGTTYINTWWSSYRHSMCYNFHDGRYGSMGFYQGDNYQILEFSDFEWEGYTAPPKEEPVKLRFSW